MHDNVTFTEKDKENVLRELRVGNQKLKRFNPVYWTVFVSAAALLIFMSILLINNPSTEQLTSGELLEEVEKVNLTIKEQTELPSGEVKYVIEVFNDSNYPIKKGELYLSYDVKIKNGAAGNPFKMIIDLHNDLEAGEKTDIEAIATIAIFDPNKVYTQYLTLDLKGYFNEVSNENFFHIGQSNTAVTGS